MKRKDTNTNWKSSEDSNIFGIYLSVMRIFLISLCVGSFVYMCWHTSENYRSQSRSFEIYGVRITFEQKNSYSIGSQPLPTYTGNNNPIADIWLPTSLIPSNIGSLKLKGDEVIFELNNQVDYMEPDIKLDNKIHFPYISSVRNPRGEEDKIIKEKNIPQNLLEKGIWIYYAEGNNQYLRLQLKRIPGQQKTYDLLFTPNPNHLRTQLHVIDKAIKDTIEVSYGYAPNTVSDTMQIDLFYFPYNNAAKNSLSCILRFEDDRIYVDGKTWTGDTLPNSNLLARVVPAKELTYFWNVFAINILFLLLVCLSRSIYLTSCFEELYRLITIPIYILAIFYNISIILLSHYFFHFSFGNEDIFNMYTLSGYVLPFSLFFIYYFDAKKSTKKTAKKSSNNNEKYSPTFYRVIDILIGITIFILIVIYQTKSKFIPEAYSFVFVGFLFLLILSRLANHIISLFKITKDIYVKYFMWFLVVAIIGLCFLFHTNQRVAFLPAHIFGRLMVILGCTAIGIEYFRKKNKNKKKGSFLWFVLEILVVIGIYVIITHDMGFGLISTLMLLLFIICCNSLSNWNKTVMIFITIGLYVGIFYSLASIMEKPLMKGVIEDYQVARIELLKDKYEEDTKFRISDKESADKHRILLSKGLNEYKWGLGSKFNIPASFKNVIWSDYILLYAFNYFGFFGSLIFILVPLLILVANLFYISFISFNYINLDSKKTFKLGILPPVVAVILLSYASQYIYMVGAILRIFPLTGQSMPFLSISWTEPIIMIFFLLLAYIIFSKEFIEKNKNKDTYSQDIIKDVVKPSYMYLLVVVCLVVGFIWAYYKVKDKKVPSGIVTHRHELKEAGIYNNILERLCKTDKTNRYWKPTETYDGLINICSEVLKKNKNDKEVKKKVYFLISELSKLTHGRNSYILKPSSDKNNKLTYRSMDIGKQNLTFFADNLVRREKSYSDRIPLGQKRIRFYKYKNKDRYIISVVHPSRNIKCQSFKGLEIVDQEIKGDNLEILYDNSSLVFCRRINNENLLSYSGATLYSGLPLFQEDFNSIKKYGLTIDERLQAITYGLLHSYCKNFNIKAGGIVIIENSTGKVKALVSYPFLKPNQFDYWKSIEKNALFGKVRVDRDLGSIPLTAYPMASTWKAFQAATALQIDLGYKDVKLANMKMKYHIPHSTNPYSIALFKELLKKHSTRFFELMDSEYGIPQYKSKLMDSLPDYYQTVRHQQATMGDRENELVNPRHKRHELALKNTPLGQYNVEVPLIVSVRDFARIITGKKVHETLFNYPEITSFRKLYNAENLACLKDYLNLTTCEGGTANALRAANNSIFDKFDKKYRLYAKTGTGDLAERRHLLILFGNEKYSFGVFMYNRGKDRNNAATHLATRMIPYINALCPEYLQK